MIAGVRPYGESKASGAPWLGDVPEHWDVRKLRTILRRVTERSRPDLPLLSVVREKGVIVRDVSSKDENRNYVPDDLTNYKVVHRGQFVMNKMKAWQGSYGISWFDGIVSPAYFVFDLAGVDGAFFHAAVRSQAYIPYFTQASDGVRISQWDLSLARMREIPFLVPPLPEQVAIVRFLRHFDDRFRRHVGAKQLLVKLLEEQRQSLIHRAVTGGINAAVRLKPSGIEWLGLVPEHWDVMQLRRLVRHGRRITYGIVQPGEPDPTGRFMVRGQDYSAGWAAPDDIFRVSPAIEEPYRRSRLSPGDLLMTIVGAGVGNIAVVPHWLDGANITQTTARISVDPVKAVPRFVGAALAGPVGRTSVELHVKGAAQPGLNLEHLKQFPVPVPPIDEQHAIVAAIEEASEPLEVAKREAVRQLLLLREYRSHLIADVVTGMLNVREAAARLPRDGGGLEPPLGRLPGAEEELIDDVDAVSEEVLG